MILARLISLVLIACVGLTPAVAGASATPDQDRCYAVMASPIEIDGEAALQPQQTACRYASPGAGHAVHTLSWETDCGGAAVVTRFAMEFGTRRLSIFGSPPAALLPRISRSAAAPPRQPTASCPGRCPPEVASQARRESRPLARVRSAQSPSEPFPRSSRSRSATTPPRRGNRA